jgi:hypothetical protein
MLQAVLAIATLLGGISAIWYFWDKIVGFRVHRQPAQPSGLPLAQNPTREQILRTVMASQPTDWARVTTNARTVVSFKNDANLRLQIKYSGERIQCDDFRESWATRHADPSATGYSCELFYGATLVERFILVAVDGGRALLPIPKRALSHAAPDSVLPLDYQIARIFDTTGNLDDYLRWSGLRL